MSIRPLLKLLFAMLLLLDTTPLQAAFPKGIAGGNPTVSNSDFDFNMKRMGSWIDESESKYFGGMYAGASDVPVATWFFRNKDPQPTQSWMNIDFFAGVPVTSVEELEEYLRVKFPEQLWHRYDDTNMIGFKSNEVRDPSDPEGLATTGRLVYFMDRKMIVSVSWRRHQSNGGVTDVSTMIASMDRYTAPPKIVSVNISSPHPVKPDDRLCYQIRVDDLKSSFTHKGLKEFKVTGIPNYWIWTDVQWNEDRGTFDICLNLPENITKGSELLLDSFRIENDRGRAASCKLLLITSPPELHCANKYGVNLTVPDVENSNPDLAPPKISSITLEQTQQKYSLSGHVADDTDITGGWLLVKQIPGDETSIFLAPWQINRGRFDISLDAASGNGTRRISEIIFADKHGNTSRLMPCDQMLADGKMTSKNCNSQNYVHCVSVSENLQSCEDTGIAVIEYFSQYRNQ